MIRLEEKSPELGLVRVESLIAASLRRTHDCEDPGGLRGITRVFRSTLQVGGVVAKFLEVPLTFDFKRAQVMLVVWVVIQSNASMVRMACSTRGFFIGRQRIDSRRHHDLAFGEGLA